VPVPVPVPVPVAVAVAVAVAVTTEGINSILEGGIVVWEKIVSE
jgi:hypothetical protein